MSANTPTTTTATGFVPHSFKGNNNNNNNVGINNVPSQPFQPRNTSSTSSTSLVPSASSTSIGVKTNGGKEGVVTKKKDVFELARERQKELHSQMVKSNLAIAHGNRQIAKATNNLADATYSGAQLQANATNNLAEATIRAGHDNAVARIISSSTDESNLVWKMKMFNQITGRK